MTEEATLTANPSQTADATLPKISGYTLLREKGRGPKAVVYKARRIYENDIVAVKLFHRGVCDRAMAGRIEAAIEKTANLNHAGLIRALGFGSDGGRSFMILEYASGESLANFLFRRQQFPPAKALSVILHCAQTLKFAAEKGFFHGRLHPGRIVLGRNNVRMAGVGMDERPEHAAWSVQFPHLFEPLVYTPPEAMPAKPFPDNQPEAVDVYALGGILFHLLTCMPPFKGNDEGSIQNERGTLKDALEWPADSRAAFPRELPVLIESMLDPDPAKRPRYDRLIPDLAAIQWSLQKSGATGWHHGEAGDATENGDGGGGVISGFGPARGDTNATVIGAPSHLAGSQVRNLDLPQTIGTPTVPLTPALKEHAAPPRQLSRKQSAVRMRRSGWDVFFSTLLFCMTTMAFFCAVYVTAKPYIPEKYWLPQVAAANGNGKGGTAGAGTAAPSNTAQEPAAAAPKAPSPDPVNLEDSALALRQLDKVQEMLRNGEIVPSPGLARVLRAISDRAGRATPTGIRALILAGEIESKIAPGKAQDPLPPPPVTPVAPPAPPVATVKVETPAQPAPAKPVQPDKPVPKPIPGVASLVKQTRQQLKYFGYVKAKDVLEQFAAKGDTEQKRLAADYKTLVNYEEGLYERTRAQLLDHIRKDPRHESMLQVFPRKDDPVGDDIIDFDDKGLHILVRGGPNQGVKITPWDKFPAAQLLNLLLPLSNKNSLEDQLGLAVFAFNRGLAPEADEMLEKAEKIAPDGKEKAGAFADTFGKIKRALEAPE